MEPGTSLGPYRIGRELGSGGMGRVFEAVVVGRCPGLDAGARIALKVVHPHLLESPGYFKRFLREGEIGKGVRHPNVVRTFDCDQLVVDGTHHSFLSMEYVEGQTLRSLLAELERVPEQLCRHIGREVCKGLAAIHAAGVIHRDVKPDNVLITPDHIVKVMDLGVARLTDEALRLSQTGAFVGSIQYAAPECFQHGGVGVDGRADLHALGIVLYELSAGMNPYVGEQVPQILQKVLHEEPRRLGDVNPQLSPFFEEVVHTLLAKSPDERFASATELLAVLKDGEDSSWWRGRALALRAASKRPLRRIRVPRETAVHGRDKELATLTELFEQAQAGEGQVVLIEGEAGIGKTRLVDELIARLQHRGTDLNFLFGSYPPGGAASASGALSTAFREQFGEEGAAPYLPQTPLLVPAFDAVLRGDVAPDDAQGLTNDSLANCFVQASRAVAARRPTVILIDDLHFAPEEARSLFSALAMAVPGHRVLLIGTMRPGVQGDWRGDLQRLEHVSAMQVERLFPKDLIALLYDRFESEELASSLAAQIAVKSDGNPFFAFEIIRGLREEQFITQQEDGTWTTTREIEQIQIPSSVLDLVNARVADLTESERELLDVAACWGFEFDGTLIGDCLGRARIPTLRQLALIEKKHRLVRCVGERFVFDHHQVQEALYGALPPQLAREYHAALAAALETRTSGAGADPATLDGAVCVDLCTHFLRGGQGGAALRYLTPAASHLSSSYLNAQVEALLEQALAVPDLLTGAQRARVLLDLASSLHTVARRDRQAECVREAERLAESSSDEELRGRAAHELGRVCYRTDRVADAEAAFRRAAELAIARGDRESEAQALGNLATVFRSQGRVNESVECHEKCIALSVETGNRDHEATAIGNLGGVLWRAGRGAEARTHWERAIAIARDIGERVTEAFMVGNLAVALLHQGFLREAREHLERSIALSREIGHRQNECLVVSNLGAVDMAEGRVEAAKEHQERALALSRETGARSSEAVALHNLATAYLEQGETARAKVFFEASLSLADEIGFVDLATATRRSLGGLHSSSGDVDAAREVLAQARRTARENGWPADETLARCALACLPDGDASDAVAAFAENEALLDATTLREVRFLLWKATGDRAHLEEAKRLVDASVAHVDGETRTSMLTNLRVNREIMAAWAQQGGDSGV